MAPDKLCFNSQVEFIRSRCQDRLNIIKILSHKSWKLNNKTLVGSQKQISRGYKYFKISLSSLFTISPLTSRRKLEKLFIRYLKNCFGHKNTLITSLSKEYVDVFVES
ncbi:hypothetical protein BpHYR1_002010 [Brachionus plicatilis]|uniref:RNA-directed DNA polymerase from mobile element jockey-like n=1 Tax=Brachionus plicatilis TaxID=10195 RepID=A0A3M7RXT6_BRAPC|nr:hypothetical protein BpHYR1_002010 [Brachionus plicatilis]